MDILNFIYWVRNKRIVTSAPQDALIPLGIKDPRRDDDYLTCAIKVSDLGAGTSIVDVTYSELYNATVNGELVPGTWYRVPYNSVNFLNGWEIANQNPTPTDPNFDPREIYKGEEEILLVQAITPYSISEIGYSEKYPDDIIQYEPYINKIGVDIGNITNGNTLPDSSIISGFDLQWDGTNVYFNMPTGYPALLGHYFYLYAEFDGGNYFQDGCFEPLTPGISYCQYPYSNDNPLNPYPKAVSRIKLEDNGMKVILLDLTETDYLNYDADTLYVDTVYALGDAYGWITRRQDTLRNIDIPFDFRARLYRRFEVDLSSINSSLGTGYYGQGDDYLGQGTTGNFYDFKSVGETGDVWNVTWDDMGGPDMYWYRGFNDNNVFDQFSDISIDYNCRNNTINYFSNNTVKSYFKNNTAKVIYQNNIKSFFESNRIGSDFYQNTINDFFGNNSINNTFQYNTIGNSFKSNTIGTNFEYNTIGDNFGSNTVGNSFIQNIVGNNFQFNTVSNSFFANTVGNNSSTNIIGNDFRSNTITGNLSNNIIGDSFQFNEVSGFLSGNLIANFFQRNKIDRILLGTNFTLATHVYGDYTCQIFKRSDNTLQLSYVDGTNTVQYTAITA
jgi:hypothetical protein